MPWATMGRRPDLAGVLSVWVFRATGGKIIASHCAQHLGRLFLGLADASGRRVRIISRIRVRCGRCVMSHCVGPFNVDPDAVAAI